MLTWKYSGLLWTMFTYCNEEWNTKTYPICDDPLLRSVRRRTVCFYTESARSTLPSWCVNRSPIRYGFRAGTKAIWYTVDHPASRGFLLARFWCTLERVDFQCRVIFTCIKFTLANKIEVMRERSLASVKVQLKVEPRAISRFSSAISILPLFYLRD